MKWSVFDPMKNIFKRSALGAHVPHNKNTAAKATEKMPLPASITLPMSQHIGAPATPAVKKGDQVYVGTIVGKGNGFVSSDIHSGVSGTVSAIGEMLLSNGNLTPTVVITPDGEQIPDPALKIPAVTDRESFIAAIRESGLVGLGGAGFPTAVKLSPKNLSEIDTLIINAAECEPFITADHRAMLEDTDDIIEGIKLVQKYLEIPKAIIGVEKNKPDAIALLQSKVDGSTISVKVLPSVYPQGAEKIIIESCLGREVPGNGGLPSDVGCIVMNVASVAFVAKYMRTGMPLTTKRVTVDGDIVKEPKNVEVVVGTPFSAVLAFCGGLTEEAKKVIAGGPMMGSAVYDIDTPVTKTGNAILAFGEKMAHQMEASPCIHCGRCINACPMGLSTEEISAAYERADIDELNALETSLCMECGTCSFVCPAKRPLTQTMRMAKLLIRNGGNK